MLKNLLCVCFAFISVLVANSQIVTSQPSPLQEDSPNVVVFYHADMGNRNLAGVAPSTAVYAHTGVLTNKSNGENDWRYAPEWLTNTDKYRLQYVSENLWKLEIGDLRSYYGITDPTETIEKLAFVFRNSNGSLQGKTATGGDIFLDVSDAGLQVILSADIDGFMVSSNSTTVTFTAGCTQEATLTLSINGETVSTAMNATSIIYPYTFVETGDYEIAVTAQTAEDKAQSILSLVYPSPSALVSYPGMQIGQAPPMGPVVSNDGKVTFCIAAPGKNQAMIVGAWNNYSYTDAQTMNYTTDENGFRYYWWTADVALNPDIMYGYYFIFDGNVAVSDPYARLVLDPFNDKYLDTSAFTGLPPYPTEKINDVPLGIYYGNINNYNWKVTDFKGPDPSNLIIYELLLRDFTGTEGKAEGNGTVKQAMDKLPYLVELGVNAIELLPINEFEGNLSWGYNPNFYFAPDKAYGTPSDYKEFIDLCHQNGIAVLLDVVFNQSTDLHPWCTMYGGIENSPFYNSGFNGENGSPHAYSVLNDWNQGFPLVQQQWRDVLTYWLTEYHVDGFRFDLVKGLGDNDSYANSSESATDAYNQSRIDRMIALQEVVKAVNPNAYFINEDLATAAEENAMAIYGQMNWANINDPGCQFAMGYSSDSNLNRMYAPDNNGRLWGSTVSYLESHDEQRLAYKQLQYAPSEIKNSVVNRMHRLGSAAAQMILSPGTHMIWQFSEMGNSQNTKTSIGNNTDPKTVNWALLDNPDHEGLYKNYCQLISIRNENPELFAENASFSMACNSNNWTQGRYLYSYTENKTKECYTLINPNTTGSITMNNVPFASSSNDDYYIASQSYDSNATFDASAKTVTVPANCYVTIASRNVTDLVGVKGNNNVSSIDFTASHGTITVNSTQSLVSVYGLDGVLIGKLRSNESINVQSGIYLLVEGDDRVKITVR